ncbi:hypothetical protein FRIGORI9N_100021 [Frigoribacterium sp. 9N]|nr:hypothetical protein FRIGORI9N_100021 [Frigoribacterium sp. 9N]
MQHRRSGSESPAVAWFRLQNVY